MLKIRFVLTIGLLCWLLAGCMSYLTNPPGQSAGADKPGFLASLGAIHDPDGDGDAKGFGYFAFKRPATGKWVFVFDPNYNAWAAYNEAGDLVNTGRASGGKTFCPDVNRGCKTIAGRFRLLRKGDADCESSIYPLETNGGAPMPYCMFFSDRGYAIHGSYDVPDRNASHGCVRVTPTAAEWISENFMLGSTVIVLPYEHA